MGSFTIARLGEADAAAYRALRAHGLAHAPDAFRVAPEDEAHVALDDDARTLRDAAVYGGSGEHRLLGIAGYRRFEGAKLRHRALLWGMYVHPDARGSGLADALVGRVIEHARAEVRSLLLTVAADNGRAIRLYERHGFTIYGREPRAIRRDAGEVDEILMSCALVGARDAWRDHR